MHTAISSNCRFIAGVEFVLLCPASIFMSALVVRRSQALPHVSRAAQQIVMAYANHSWTLWILLIALPLVVLITGSATLLAVRDGDRNNPERKNHGLSPGIPRVAATTVAALSILGVVILHMLAN